jgi:tRNA nucleotidyltransferase (CCA-adding enzyme)
MLIGKGCGQFTNSFIRGVKGWGERAAMKVNLEKTGKYTFQMIKAIGALADKKGMKAFLVGGSVRDIFLKRTVKDIDVVLEGDAIDFAQTFAAQKGLVLKTHKRFGTATVSQWNHVCVDVVTARREMYPFPGSLPVVHQASLKEDVFRRDFTMNALAVSINQRDFGLLIDLCSGLEDLNKGRIKVFHEKSFLDDPTRILRAVRFEQRFGFRLSAQTLRLLKSALAEKAYAAVSAPRYFQEFARGFFEDQPGKYLLRLNALGALDFLGQNIIVERKTLKFFDSERKKVKGLDAHDPARIYLSALYARCDDDEIIERGKSFHWVRSERKKILETVHALRQAG